MVGLAMVVMTCAETCTGTFPSSGYRETLEHESPRMQFGAHYLPTYIPTLDGPEPEFYRRMFEQMELLDQVGFHQVWVTEHHFHE
jgi:hypothetical protein